MELTKRMGVWLLVFLFLLSDTGVVVLRTGCRCTGEKRIYLYTDGKTCGEQAFSNHHAGHCCDMQTEGSCSADCDCGCNEPEARFYRIDDSFAPSTQAECKPVALELPEFQPVRTASCLSPLLAPAGVGQPFRDLPPHPPTDSLVYLYCQPKIPSLS